LRPEDKSAGFRLRVVDAPAKRVVIGFADLKLPSCRGRVPTPDGFIELEWTRTAGRLDYRLSAPAG
jgi:alpha-L-rhamnosidase